MLGLGRRPILALFFNYTKQDLVLATKTVAILEQKNIEFSSPYIQSQDSPVNMALYNPLFKQVKIKHDIILKPDPFITIKIPLKRLFCSRL